MAPTSTTIRNATNVSLGSIWFGDFQEIGMCWLICSTKPTLRKYAMKTATPPIRFINQFTAVRNDKS